MLNNINPKFVFPATLLVGPPQNTNTALISLSTRLGHPHLPNPDSLLISPDTDWGIGAIRQIDNFLAQKTYSHPSRLVIISQADTLEIPAQNALLKTIENPGPDCYLILTAARPHRLLSTIISRCHSINLSHTASISAPTCLQTLNDVDRFLASSPDIPQYLHQLLVSAQAGLITQPTLARAQQIAVIIHCLSLLDHRVDPKLALDYYVLKTFTA